MTQPQRMHIYQPAATPARRDCIVITHLGFNSTPENTRRRLTVLATALNTTVVAVTRRGTNTTQFDPRLRAQLGSPEAFLKLCAQDAQLLEAAVPDLHSYPIRLIEGSSGGGASALGMVLADSGLATHLLIREGYNHLAPESQLRGAFRIIKDILLRPPIASTPQQRKAWQPDAQPSWAGRLRTALRLIRTGYIEMRHWGISSCSDFTVVAAGTIAAARPNVTLRSIEFEQGLGGNVAKSRQLAHGLSHARDGIAGAAPVVAEVVSGRHHADLLDPLITAADITGTIALGQTAG